VPALALQGPSEQQVGVGVRGVGGEHRAGLGLGAVQLRGVVVGARQQQADGEGIGGGGVGEVRRQLMPLVSVAVTRSIPERLAALRRRHAEG
jgi:hypothetical protein